MRWWPCLMVLIALGLGLAAHLPARAEGETGPDYEFFKERVWPQLQQLCAQCHADPRKRARMGRFFLRPLPGRSVRERHHEDNFEEVLKFVEPGNPAASTLLLKAIGPDRGGVTHEGGVIFGENDVAYGAIIDFINGTTLPRRSWRPPPSAEGQPDFLYYYKHIAPVTGTVCAECHALPGKGRMKVIVPAAESTGLTLEDHYANYEAVLRLVSPGQPLKSRFLVKPLAEADGGFKHKGGDRIFKDDVNYLRWVEFITGVRGPPLPASGRPPAPVLTTAGLRLQAEDLRAEGDLTRVDRADAEQYVAMLAGPMGGELDVVIDVQDAGPYRVQVRTTTGGPAPSLTIGDGGAMELFALSESADGAPFVDVGPQNLQDGSSPLLALRGNVQRVGAALQMDGREQEAGWLSPAELRHTGVSARVRVAPEEDGGDDAWLLFDMQDEANGKFLGLIDGERRLVLGVLEGGRARVLRAEKAPDPPEGSADPPHDGTRELKVEYFAGVVVGSLDGKPLLHVNLDKGLGEGLFGIATHGRLEVLHVAALEEYEVYAVTFGAGSVVELPRGRVRLVLSLPPGCGPVDALSLRAP